MSHTPGPWSYEESGWDGLPFLMAANGDVIATFFSEPENSDDISLLAAAPELYEALEALSSKVWRIIDLHLDPEARAEANMALKRAYAALIKARGDAAQGENFEEAEYRRLLEAKKANALLPQEEERIIQLYEEGKVDDVPSVFLRSEVQQKMDSLIGKIGELIQEIKARGDGGEENA